MASYINVKNKQGLTKLATLIREAGFDDVKVTVKDRSITLTSDNAVNLKAGLADLKAGRYVSFKDPKSAANYLSQRRLKSSRRSVTKRR